MYFKYEDTIQAIKGLSPLPSNFLEFQYLEPSPKPGQQVLKLETKTETAFLRGKKLLWLFLLRDKNNLTIENLSSNMVFQVIDVPFKEVVAKAVWKVGVGMAWLWII